MARKVYLKREYHCPTISGFSITAERNGESQNVKIGFSTVHQFVQGHMTRNDVEELRDMLVEILQDWEQ